MFSLVAMAMLEGKKPRGVSGRKRCVELSARHHTQSQFECFSASDVTHEELIGDRIGGVGSAVRGAGWR